MATKKSSRRTPRDPREMSRDDLVRLIDEIDRKVALIAELADSETWKVLAKHIDERIQRLENVGRDMRRMIGRPIAGKPAVTLEQIASHEARISETRLLRGLPKTILSGWQAQLDQLHAIRDEAPR